MSPLNVTAPDPFNHATAKILLQRISARSVARRRASPTTNQFPIEEMPVAFCKRMRGQYRLLVRQIACEMSPRVDLGPFGLMPASECHGGRKRLVFGGYSAPKRRRTPADNLVGE